MKKINFQIIMQLYRNLTWAITVAMFLISLTIYVYYSSEWGFSLFAALLTAALTAASLIIIGWFIEALLPRR